MSNAGFSIPDTEKYFIQDNLQDKFLYSGKNNPGIYLDDTIRKGISSFAALANEAEINRGLEKLGGDLETGEFKAIKDKYDNANGDYLFVVAKKPKSRDL